MLMLNLFMQLLSKLLSIDFAYIAQPFAHLVVNTTVRYNFM